MRSSRFSRGRLAPVAIITTAALSLGIIGLTALPANALPSDVAVGEGQLLTGGGAIDTDGVAALAPAYSATPSGSSPVTNALDLTALSSVGLDVGNVGLLSGANPILQLGVDGQYASTDASGTAFASSGAINNDGSINVGAGSDTSDDTTLNLTPLLGTAGVDSSLVSALEVQLGAISASASGSGGTTTGDYQIAGGNIIVNSPAVATADSTLTTTLSGLTSTLNTALGNAGLVNSITGPLTTAVNTLGLGVVSLNGTTVNASLTTADLSNVLASAGTASSSDGGVTIDLANGTVTIDLAAVLGGSLDNLPPNTNLLSTAAGTITSDLSQAVSNLVSQVTQAAQTELYSETLNVQVNTTADVLGLPIGTIGLDVSGTLGGFLGASGYATPTTTSTTNIVGLDLSNLTSALVSGVVPALTTAVGDVINPLLPTDLTGPIQTVGNTLGTALNGLEPALNDVVTLVANVQQTSSTTPAAAFTTTGAGPADFSERALAVTLLPTVPASLTTLNLASATVRSTSQLTLTPDQGPTAGGQGVTISGGAAIDNATSVDFGGTTYYLAGSNDATNNPTAPTFTQDSTTGDISLTTQPTAAGQVNVTVTSPTGTSSPATYTFIAPPSSLAITPN